MDNFKEEEDPVSSQGPGLNASVRILQNLAVNIGFQEFERYASPAAFQVLAWQSKLNGGNLSFSVEETPGAPGAPSTKMHGQQIQVYVRGVWEFQDWPRGPRAAATYPQLINKLYT